MAKTKVAVTLDSQTLRRVDRLVRDARYPNRSQAKRAVRDGDCGRADEPAPACRIPAHARANHASLAEAILGEDQPDPNARNRADRESPRPSIA